MVVGNLDKEWADLMLKAEQTDYNMGSYKKGFIEHTQREIMKFKE